MPRFQQVEAVGPVTGVSPSWRRWIAILSAVLALLLSALFGSNAYHNLPDDTFSGFDGPDPRRLFWCSIWSAVLFVGAIWSLRSRSTLPLRLVWLLFFVMGLADPILLWLSSDDYRLGDLILWSPGSEMALIGLMGLGLAFLGSFPRQSDSTPRFDR